MKPLHELPPPVRACIASVKTTKKHRGDDVQGDVVEVRLWDKLRALEMATKHFGLLRDRLEHQGDIVIRWVDDDG